MLQEMQNNSIQIQVIPNIGNIRATCCRYIDETTAMAANKMGIFVLAFFIKK